MVNSSRALGWGHLMTVGEARGHVHIIAVCPSFSPTFPHKWQARRVLRYRIFVLGGLEIEPKVSCMLSTSFTSTPHSTLSLLLSVV